MTPTEMHIAELRAKIARLEAMLVVAMEALILGTGHPETGGVFWRENALDKLEAMGKDES